MKSCMRGMSAITCVSLLIWKASLRLHREQKNKRQQTSSKNNIFEIELFIYETQSHRNTRIVS